MPLDLKSSDWANITHAYGPATETPDLLRRIYSNPSADDWGDLYATLAHQGSISTAAYAAVPHVILAAQRMPHGLSRLDYLCFAGFVASGYDKEPIPGELESEYHEAIERGRLLAIELSLEPCDFTNSIYILQALAALSGKTVLARVIEGLADREFQVTCPACRRSLYVEIEKNDFIAWEHDPVQVRDGVGQLIKPSSILDGSALDLDWLRQYASQMCEGQVTKALYSMNGEYSCPRCPETFNLYAELSREASSS